MVCGSNKETYENLCQLTEDANESDEKIHVEREGPCKGGKGLESNVTENLYCGILEKTPEIMALALYDVRVS